MFDNKLILNVLILLVCSQFILTEALQCFTCNNCERVDHTEDLKICNKQAAADNDYDYSDEDFEGNFKRSGKIDILRKPTNRQMQPPLGSKPTDDICYMVQISINGTLVTHRGCSSMIRENKNMTCKSVASGQEWSKCEICKADGCNRFFNEMWENMPLSGENLSAKIWLLAFLPFVLIFREYQLYY